MAADGTTLIGNIATGTSASGTVITNTQDNYIYSQYVPSYVLASVTSRIRVSVYAATTGNNTAFVIEMRDSTLSNIVTTLAANLSGTSGTSGVSGTSGTSGNNGTSGTSGVSGSVGPAGPTGATGPIAGSDTQIIFNDANNPGASPNLTFNKSTNLLSLNGNASFGGTGSNLIRRAYGLVAYDTPVTLDDLSASVTNSPVGQLKLQTTGSWLGTGWTETYQGGGTPSVSFWINLPLSSGFSPASGAIGGQQGYGCRCMIGDQTPNPKLYMVTVTKLGTSGNQWAIAIERLV